MFPVFVIGESRTGTLSLHNFFIQNGLSSLHYYVEESNQKLPLHEHMSDNINNLKKFLENTDINCFTDYPTRIFYAELAEWYPDASFILTTRSSTNLWLQSMEKFLQNFNISLDTISATSDYENVNDNIRTFFVNTNLRFLEICIDEDNNENTIKLAKFLEIENPIALSINNSNSSIDNDILSTTHQLYPLSTDDPLKVIELFTSPSKAILSEYGWLFLGNDTNQFLHIAFGKKRWSQEETLVAIHSIEKRIHYIKTNGANYFKFIIPEKCIVYQEYLPRILKSLTLNPIRPSTLLQQALPENVKYLADYLIDARSYGQLYFRGDTHTNWLGAWFIYVYIIRILAQKNLVDINELLNISDLHPTIAAYEGDLSALLPPKLLHEYNKRLDFITPKNGFDITIQYTIPDAMKRAKPVSPPEKYLKWFSTRQTHVYERKDDLGLRAVIFRDSTADFCHELLAQHFKRSVFIWHQGQVYDEVIKFEKPDIVIHIMAERFVSKYSSFPPICSVRDSYNED